MAKIIVIGAGHNGLVCACYLALAGHDVEIFEKNSFVGGCCSTDQASFPGCSISTASYVNGLFHLPIVEDLQLRNYGYEVLERNPSSFTPLLDGRYLIMGSDPEQTRKEIAKFSERDAHRYPEYEASLGRMVKIIEPTLIMTPPDVIPSSFEDLGKYGRLAWSIISNPAAAWQFSKLFGSTSAIKFLNSWFESDVLKATLLTDAAIGAMGFSGYVLLHHVMGESGNEARKKGIWGYQKGGTGGLAESLAGTAKSLGIKIYLNAKVSEILTRGSSATGVKLSDGEKCGADCVISNLDCSQTFLALIANEYWGSRHKSFLKKIRSIDYTSATMKVNLVLSELPNFKCLDGTTIGQHNGTIHIAPSVEYILKAEQEGARGEASTRPVLEITIPSAVDKSLVTDGSGRHIMNIFVQYVPYYSLSERSHGETLSKEKYFEKNILPQLEIYIENPQKIIEGLQILSPHDLEDKFGLTGGNYKFSGEKLAQKFLKFKRLSLIS